MGRITIHLPESLHKAVRELAKRENVSIKQLSTLALAEKVSALRTEEYLTARAQWANRNKFDATLAKVPDVPTDKRDRL